MFSGVAVPVALLAEGVDRNALLVNSSSVGVGVALLAEGVDRNDYRNPYKP